MFCTMSKAERISCIKVKNESENSLKRKFEDVEHKSNASSDDEEEDSLFLPQGLFTITEFSVF